MSYRSLIAFAVLSGALGAQTPAPPPPPDTLVLRANALMQSKQYAEAAGLYERATEQHPDQFVNWVRLGMARQLGGEGDGAMTAYRKAITLGAGQTAKYNVGTLFALAHAPDSAFHWLQESVRAGFSNLQTLKDDHDLQGLHGDPRWAALVDTMTRAATPCMYRPESRAFDFWIGDWDVTTAAGQAAGTSSVQLLLDGCALYENWTSASNGSGKSLNSYNPELGMWQQFWTDRTGSVTEYRTSEWVGPSLRYTAQQLQPARATLHMTFTPVTRDLVRQAGEISTDGGKTWTTQYDLYYHRRK